MLIVVLNEIPVGIGALLENIYYSYIKFIILLCAWPQSSVGFADIFGFEECIPYKNIWMQCCANQGHQGASTRFTCVINMFARQATFRFFKMELGRSLEPEPAHTLVWLALKCLLYVKSGRSFRRIYLDRDQMELGASMTLAFACSRHWMLGKLANGISSFGAPELDGMG
jgi:hypothetical protein